MDEQHKADALRNGWNPKKESLTAWRARRSTTWKAERDRTLRSGRY